MMTGSPRCQLTGATYSRGRDRRQVVCWRQRMWRPRKRSLVFNSLMTFWLSLICRESITRRTSGKQRPVAK